MDDPALLALYDLEAHVLPPMAALESPAPQPLDPGEEENSPDTPSSVLSSQDIFEPVTPSRQSES